MNKAILIGNGFSSNLISAYSNYKMVENLISRIKDEYTLADNLFEAYRIHRKEKKKINKYGGGLYPSADLFPSEDLYPRSDYIIYDEEIKLHIINILAKQGFEDPTEIYEKYFISYGLFFETNQDHIISVESLLKIVSMFSKIDKFEQEVEMNIISNANEVILIMGIMA